MVGYLPKFLNKFCWVFFSAVGQKCFITQKFENLNQNRKNFVTRNLCWKAKQFIGNLIYFDWHNQFVLFEVFGTHRNKFWGKFLWKNGASFSISNDKSYDIQIRKKTFFYITLGLGPCSPYLRNNIMDSSCSYSKSSSSNHKT